MLKWALAAVLVLELSLAACRGTTSTPSPTATETPAATPTASPTTGSTPTATASPTETPATATATPIPTLTATPQATPPPALSQAVERIHELLPGVRGLEFTRDTPPRLMTSQELNAYLSERITEEDRGDLTNAQHLYILLGLMEPEVDLTELFLALLGEQVLGLFDPADESLYVISESSEIGIFEELTLAHEYTHALQHQHFDLNRLSELHEEGQNSDAGAAVTALVEGDATLTEFLYGARRFTRQEMEEAFVQDRPSDVYDSAPEVVRKILVFPYTDGFSFVQALYITGGFEPVDIAFQSPPQSTEQILHPEMYQQGHGPVTVTLSANEGMTSGGWEVGDEDTMGEFFLRTWLEEIMAPAEASAAAAGWGGDRYHLFRDDAGRHALGLVTLWDSDEDATEFEEALDGYVDERLAPGAAAQVERSGMEVRLGVAPDEDTLSLLINGLTIAS